MYFTPYSGYQLPFNCSPYYFVPQFCPQNLPQNYEKSLPIILKESQLVKEQPLPRGNQSGCSEGKLQLSSKHQSKGRNDQKSLLRIEKSKPVQKNKKDDEFIPYTSEKKKKQRIFQNQNRNVVPNIIHQIIAFVFKKSRSGPITTALLKSMEVENCSVKRYYTYISLAKEKVNNYVDSSCLSVFTKLQDLNCEIYSEEEQRIYNKIARIMINHFFNHEFQLINLTSKKMRSDKRIDHLQAKRRVLETFKLAIN